MASAGEAGAQMQHHAVSFVAPGDELVEHYARFAAEGLLHGEPVLVLLDPCRTDAFRDALALQAVDVDRVLRDGLLVVMDACATLDAVIDDGRLSPEHLDRVVGPVVADLVARGGLLRCCGEVAGLLWQRGDHVGALELEARWAEYLLQHPIALLCSYDLEAFTEVEDLALLAAVCDHHDAISTATPSRPLGRQERPTRTFVPAPASVSAARHFVQDVLDAWGTEPLLAQDIVLATSELATNAVLHAASPFRVTLARTGNDIRVAVEDASAVAPELRSPTVELASGRGIAMVDAISRRWGVDVHREGKCVWAEFAPADEVAHAVGR